MANYPQVAVIINPASTQNRKSGKGGLASLRKVINKHKNIIEIELGMDVEAGLSNVMKNLALTQPELIIVSGGDGTIQGIFSSLINDKPFEIIPPIAILPSGKTNMIALDLGCRKRPDLVLEKLINLAQTSEMEEKIVKRTLLGMELVSLKKTYYGMFFGGAGVVRGINYCRDKIHPMRMPNFLTHIFAMFTLSMAAFFGSKDPKSAMYANPMDIQLHSGGRIKGQFMMVIATTLDKLLLNSRPFGTHGEGKIGFSCVEHRPLAIFRALISLITGSFSKKSINGIHTRRCDDIIITGSDPVTLDGEIYEIPENSDVHLFAGKELDFLSLK
jgi:hypothetical protein